MIGIAFHKAEDVRVEKFPEPEIISPEDVIVRVEQASICGSDLHVYFGRETGLDEGTIMGHEFVGEIVETGSSSNLKKGMRVMSPFTTNCGECYYCKTGLTSRCVKGNLFGWLDHGHGLQGAQAEYVRVPLSNSTLVEIPPELSWEQGLFLGDIFSTGYFCADQADIKPEGIYVVLGCGPVGLMAINAAKMLGAEKVFAIDKISERLQIAKSFGATSLSLNENVPDAIKEASDGRGADAVMEVVGSYEAGKLAMQILRPGGIISMVGVCTNKEIFFSPAQAYDKNLTYKVGRCPARFYIDKLLPVMRSEDLKLGSIITHRMKLSEGVNAYDIFANKKEGCMKIIMTPD